MRIAVFSDIHGNDFAFEIVEADIKKQNVDQMVCLGDAIQGGPQPADCVQRLRKLNCPVVMGNADAWLLSGRETGHEDIPAERLQKMETIRLWSLSQLDQEDRDNISNFQSTVKMPLADGLELLCFHGSPTSFDDVMLPHAPAEVFEKFLGPYSQCILTGGHTHAQQVRRHGDLFFFNPGSVGFAFSHYQPDDQFHADAWAEYAILSAENDQISLEFRRIPYPVSELVEVYAQSGRPFAHEAISQYQK